MWALMEKQIIIKRLMVDAWPTRLGLGGISIRKARLSVNAYTPSEKDCLLTLDVREYCRT